MSSEFENICNVVIIFLEFILGGLELRTWFQFSVKRKKKPKVCRTNTAR